jgi:hypothetical protein
MGGAAAGLLGVEFGRKTGGAGNRSRSLCKVVEADVAVGTFILSGSSNDARMISRIDTCSKQAVNIVNIMNYCFEEIGLEPGVHQAQTFHRSSACQIPII